MNDHDCVHIMPSGRRCGSPRKTGHRFCHWHLRLRADFNLPGTERYCPPLLEDANCVTIALNHVFLAQSRGLLDPRSARHMQWTLRLALQSFKQHDRPTPAEIYDGPLAGAPSSEGGLESPAVDHPVESPADPLPSTASVTPAAPAINHTQSSMNNPARPTIDRPGVYNLDDYTFTPEARERRRLQLIRWFGTEHPEIYYDDKGELHFRRTAAPCGADFPAREKPLASGPVPALTIDVTGRESSMNNNQSP